MRLDASTPSDPFGTASLHFRLIGTLTLRMLVRHHPATPRKDSAMLRSAACSEVDPLSGTERSKSPRDREHFARHGKIPHLPIMRRVSAVAASGRVFIRGRLVGIITVPGPSRGDIVKLDQIYLAL
jgi:hypothetical protein